MFNIHILVLSETKYSVCYFETISLHIAFDEDCVRHNFWRFYPTL